MGMCRHRLGVALWGSCGQHAGDASDTLPRLGPRLSRTAPFLCTCHFQANNTREKTSAPNSETHARHRTRLGVEAPIQATWRSGQHGRPCAHLQSFILAYLY